MTIPKKKRSNTRYLLIALLLLVTLFFALPFAAVPGRMARAEEDGIIYSDVMGDLNSATVNGQPFSTTDYPVARGHRPEMLSLTEYGFNSDKYDEYRLFLYIYNPSLLDISNTGNKVEIAVSYNSSDGLPISYAKYNLKFCSKSSSAGIENLYYKFIVELPDSSMYNRVSQNPGSRRYDISGVELLTNGLSNGVDYPIGGTYIYSGEDDDLSYLRRDIDTLSLELKSTYWRSSSSSLGSDYQNQLNSVYFSVPNSVFNAYDNLQKVHASWYETRTNGCIMSDVRDLDGTLPDGKWHLQSPGSFVFYVDSLSEYISPQDIFDYVEMDKEKCIRKNHETVFKDAPEIYAPTCLFMTESTFNDNKQSSFGRETEGRTFGLNDVVISADDNYSLLNYGDNHNFWDKVEDFGFWDTILGNVPKDESIKDIKPIVPIDRNTYGNYNENSLASSLYVNEHDATAFKSFCDTAWNNDETPFLFRFGVTQHYIDHARQSSMPHQLYFTTEVFFNFDIIDLTFTRAGKNFVIPTVASPINIVGGLEKPPEEITAWDKFLLWVKKIMSKLFGWDVASIPDWAAVVFLVVALILLGLLVKILSPFFPLIGHGLVVVFKGLFWIISAPVRLIASLFKRKGDDK